MSTQTHTPGPWTVDYSGPARLAINGPNDQEICFCSLQNEDGDIDEANARLIASAPALLAAVEKAILNCRYCSGNGHAHGLRCTACCDARSALTLARGEAAESAPQVDPRDAEIARLHTPKHLNVWPEHSTGKWIVSYTQTGTNNEKVVGEFWHQEDAEKFSAMENKPLQASAPSLLAENKRLREALWEMLREFEPADDLIKPSDAIIIARLALSESGVAK